MRARSTFLLGALAAAVAAGVAACESGETSCADDGSCEETRLPDRTDAEAGLGPDGEEMLGPVDDLVWPYLLMLFDQALFVFIDGAAGDDPGLDTGGPGEPVNIDRVLGIDIIDVIFYQFVEVLSGPGEHVFVRRVTLRRKFRLGARDAKEA